MAYFLSGSVIISDDRELIGINSAGINTALFVGNNIQLDGSSGIVTATQFFGDGSNLSGVGLTNTGDYEVNNIVAIGSVTAANLYGDGSALINIPGLSWVATGVQTERPDQTPLQDGDIYYDPTDLRQFTYYAGDGGNWRDSNPAANSAVSITVGLETALVIPGEDTLTFAPVPTTGEIVIGINTLTDTVTLGIDDDLVVGTSVEVGAGVSIMGPTVIADDEGEAILNSGIVVGAGQNLATPLTQTVNPILFIGDGRFLTNTGVGLTDNVFTEGNIQAGVITATTSLEATVATGVGLTVAADAFISGKLTVVDDLVTTKIQAGGQLFSIVDQFDLGGATIKLEQGGGNQKVDFNASNLTRIQADHVNNRVDIVAGGDLYRFDPAGAAFEKPISANGTGIGLTVANDGYFGGSVGVASTVTAFAFYGDGSNLTGVGLSTDTDIDTTGNIQAGIITATTQFDATGAGVGLTVANNVFIGGVLDVATLDSSRNNGTIVVGNSSSDRLEFNSRVRGSALNNAIIPDNVTFGSNVNLGASAAPFGEIYSQTVDIAGAGIGLTVANNVFIGGNVTIAGDLEANDVNTTSDITKKENVQEIGDALSKVNQIKGVTFDWIESGESSGGIIAQDVEKVLPTLVRQGDDHKTVIYNGIVGLLVQAVKELSAEVEELKQNK